MNIIQSAIEQHRIKMFQQHETHHILPRSLGGSNDKCNLVLLTYKEHFVCHRLLTKFTSGADRTKMIFAYWSMANKWGRAASEYKITSRVYSKLKAEVTALISDNNKGKSHSVSDKTRKILSDGKIGNKNPMFGKSAANRGVKRPGVGGRKKGTGWSEQERAIQMAIRSNTGYYDYLSDPARSEKISHKLKGRTGAASGKKWFNNGFEETYHIACPPGFRVGRLPRKQPNKVGLKWYNNGIVNKQFKDNAVIEGFVRGRIRKK
jgi:hypothetical protein